MPDIIQRSFAGGEVAPSIYGRADLTKYQTGALTVRNWVVKRHGGLANRSGLQYITPQKNSNQRARLLKFKFNIEQTYVLLFEDTSMRVIQDGVVLTVPDATAWSNATAYVIGDVAEDAVVNYYCVAAHTNRPPPDAAYWYPMPAGDIYEIPTPFLSDDLQGLYRSQSGDVITITHTAYQIRDLSRTGHTTWVITPVAMAPSIAAPGALTNNKVNGSLVRWRATAIKNKTYEESEVSPSTGTTTAPVLGVPITITIPSVTNALEYNVYRDDGSGIFGFVGVSKSGTYKDFGYAPDFSLTPPEPRDPFIDADDHPACSGYLQQRKCYGGVASDPESIYGSKTGQYRNFGVASPLRANDAITYTVASSEVNEVRHLIEVLETFILTSGVEWVALGGTDGQLTPGSPGLKPKSFYGSSVVPPVIIGDNLVFIQEHGNLVRDMNYDAVTKGYTGRDLSVFAPHLFQGKVIEHMDYAQIPDSIIWCQQGDGALIGLTYLREHEVWGWHRHDTDGWFEDVVSVPEEGEDAVYVLVRRTIDGVTQRSLERFASRHVTDVEVDAIFLDSYLSYDGRHTGTISMTLSGGTTWMHGEDLTLMASDAVFVSGDVGNAIRLTIRTETWTPEGQTTIVVTHVVLSIRIYASPTEVTVHAERTVPAAFQNVDFLQWARGVDQFSGAEHLEGKTIGILGDGAVVTNGIDAPHTVVTGGAFTTDRPYFVLHAGLAYCSDLETLDLELLGGETLAAKKKSINSVDVLVEASRGLWVGEDADNLLEWKQRTASDGYGTIPVFTGKVTVPIRASWNKGGRVFLRQRDPLPLSILNVTPNVQIGG